MGISITLTIPTPRRKRASASRRNRRNQQDPSPSPPPDSAAKHERPRRPRRLPRVPACIPCLSVRVHRTSTTVPSSNTTASSSSSSTPNPQNPRPSPTATLSSPPSSVVRNNQQQQEQVEKQTQNQVEIKQDPIVSLQPIIPPPPSTSPPPPIASTQIVQQPQPQQNESNQSASIPPPQPPTLRLPRSPSSHATSRNPSNPDQDQAGIEPEISSQPQSPNQTALDATRRITNITNNDLFTDTSRVAAIASITASATAAAVTAAFRTLCPDLIVPLSSSAGTSIQNNDQSNLITNNPNSRWQCSNQRVAPNNALSLWRNNNLPDNSENQNGPADSTQRSDLAIFMNDPRNGSSIEINMRPPNRTGTVVEISMRPPNRTAATDVSTRSSSTTSSSNAASTVIPESDDEAGPDQDNDAERSETNESNFSDLTDNENPKQYMQRMRKESPNKCVEKGLKTLASGDMYNSEVILFVVQELEELLSNTENSEAEGSPSQIDPPVRIRAHHDLAEYFHSESKPNREKVLHHCRTGLVCLPGCENKLPEIAAEMHCLYAEELVKDVPANQSLLREVIEHANSAKAALYVKPNSQLSYRIALVTGQVYATRWDEPICDNLVSAYESYHSALEIIKFSEEDRRDEYLRIGCYCVDFILRFLRHQRQAKDNPKSICNHSKNTACTKDLGLSPVLPHFNIEHALEFADKLRTVLNQCIDAEDESRDSYPVAEFKHGGNISAIHERLARCYLERSEQDKTNAAKDLAKSSHHIRRALGTYHEQKDLAMRYTFLHDLMTEVEQKQEQVGRITSGLTSNDSDTNSENSFQATSSVPHEQGSENGDKEESEGNKPEEDEEKDEGKEESKETDAAEPESTVEEIPSEIVGEQETSSETQS